ncbi:MAG TPA: hypothetical protein VF666_03680 [Pyrinomonadaceae bacterium]
MSADIQRSPETVCEINASDDLSVSPGIEVSTTSIPISADSIILSPDNKASLPSNNASIAPLATIPENSHVCDSAATPENFLTLSSLPVGSRLILRCRKDWRDATITAIEPDKIVLSVGAPTGRTYRVRRPHDAPLSLDGSIPVLGEGAWRIGLARYDCRW